MAVGPSSYGGWSMVSRTVTTVAPRDERARAVTCSRSTFVASICAVILFCLPASSQTTAGRVLGTVSDPSGAAVAGARVLLTDTQRGESRTLTTDDSGGYVAPELLPGHSKT